MNRWLKVILWVVFCAWLILLTILSSEDGSATAQTSGKITAFVMELFRIPTAHQAKVETILRIAAHFILFFLLGGLLYAAMRVTWVNARFVHIWALGICGVLGIMDEVKKIFITGRHLSWEEAGLNVIGAWCGIIVAMFVIQSIFTRQSIH